MNKTLLLVVLALFSAITAYSVHYVGGILSLIKIHLSEPAGWQIFADLVIAMCLLLAFIHRDAKANQRPFWPWAVLSLLIGSFGPLLYFITRKNQK